MNSQRRDCLLVVTLAAAFAAPAFAQEPTVASANVGKESAVPDFSGMWVHGSIPGFEPLASGPTALVNRSRKSLAQLIFDLGGDRPGGQTPQVGNILELVGDYTNQSDLEARGGGHREKVRRNVGARRALSKPTQSMLAERRAVCLYGRGNRYSPAAGQDHHSLQL
jgi:hypothetical protein